jgi:hypothetical protein
MSQAPSRAWWEDVEHLREAAERRIAERERAQREGRDRPVLTPLRPRGAEAASSSRGTGRFRRGTAVAAERPSRAAVAQARAATAEATARVLAPAEPHVDLDHWRDLEPELDLDLAPAPQAETAEPAPAPKPERPSRREELSRLAHEQARAAERAAAGRARTRVTGSGEPTRRTIEIRGQTVGAPALAAVPSVGETAPGARRRRPSRTPAERFAARPDRVAQWAFLLGLFLIVVALLSGH